MDDHRIRTDSNTSMSDPIAWFFTWPTYGAWLPGDERGWIEYHNGWQLPQPSLKLECQSRMTEDDCVLSEADRAIVERQLEQTCHYRCWQLHASSSRSNHVHAVVSAQETLPQKIRDDLKAWCTRRLNEQSVQQQDKWWAERGSIRWIWNDDSLDNVIQYVNEAQDRKSATE